MLSAFGLSVQALIGSVQVSPCLWFVAGSAVGRMVVVCRMELHVGSLTEAKVCSTVVFDCSISPLSSLAGYYPLNAPSPRVPGFAKVIFFVVVFWFSMGVYFVLCDFIAFRWEVQQRGSPHVHMYVRL